MLTQNGKWLSPAYPTERFGRFQVPRGVKAVLSPADSKQQNAREKISIPPGIAQLVAKLWRHESNKQTSQVMLDDLARRTAERAKEVSDSVKQNFDPNTLHIRHIPHSRHYKKPSGISIDIF
jgi:hypothetical protein